MCLAPALAALRANLLFNEVVMQSLYPQRSNDADPLSQENATTFQQLIQGCRAQIPEPTAESPVGDRPHLLGHRKAVLSQAALGRANREVESTAEIGSGKGNSERETETRLVQLVDRDNRKRARLGLLSSPSGIGVRPVHITLLGSNAYHSGVDASKADSISAASAR